MRLAAGYFNQLSTPDLYPDEFDHTSVASTIEHGKRLEQAQRDHAAKWVRIQQRGTALAQALLRGESIE